MADIEVVIKIDEEYYNTIKDMADVGLGTGDTAIANGVPLPKEHGDLKDVDFLKNQFPIWVNNVSSLIVYKTLLKAPTIIKATN
jgi:hypothetical protein